MDGLDDPRLMLVLALVFLAVVVAGVADLTLDDPGTWSTLHGAVELTLIALSLGLSIYLWRGWYRTSVALGRTREQLEAQQAARDAWRESARGLLEGLGEAMDRQFRAWELTPAEREVAILLIKGRSHKQIAFLTGRSERTARQHAGAVYRKSGLSGRAELAAFFLEDLMLPEPAARRPEPLAEPRSAER